MPNINNGQAGRDLMSAVFAGDRAAATRMLTADPRLATTGDGRFADLLNVAIGQCDKPMVDLLLSLGAPPNGPRGEVPLLLAFQARDPWYAERLLQAGAAPDGVKGSNGSPLTEALSQKSWPLLEMLLRHGWNFNALDELGESPLLSAVDMDSFLVAERMLDLGADPWVVGFHGGTVGASAVKPLVFDQPEEEVARQRFIARLQEAGWPWPPPDLEAVRKAVMAGQWPPEPARRLGAKPPPDWVVEAMREYYAPDGNSRPRSATPPD